MTVAASLLVGDRSEADNRDGPGGFTGFLTLGLGAAFGFGLAFVLGLLAALVLVVGLALVVEALAFVPDAGADFFVAVVVRATR